MLIEGDDSNAERRRDQGRVLDRTGPTSGK
jgi:hypothetical protein